MVAYDRSDAVFLGTLLWQKQGPDKVVKRTDQVVMFKFGGRLAKMRVTRSWKGVKRGAVILIWTTAGGGDCGYPFYNSHDGSTHLIFASIANTAARKEIAEHPAVPASDRDRVLVTGLCTHSGSTESEPARAEIDSLDSWRAQGRIPKEARPWWKAG
jgi:hypothetical protein